MAYSSNFLSSLQQTQIFDCTHNSSVGVTTRRPPCVYIYDASANGADDTTVETQAADYFLNAYATIQTGDWIIVNTNNPAYHILAVTASSANTVTTSQVA